MKARLQGLERGGGLLPPVVKQGVHAANEGGKLCVLVDGGLDGAFVHRQSQVAWAQRRKQRLAQLRAHSPVGLQRIHIGRGYAALQVTCNVLQVFGHAGVDVARQV